MRILAILLFLVFGQSAFAATTTESHVLGFSKDGRYFVFEEFAVYDGAGIPKATLYVIDTVNDSWVPGTPVSTDRGEEDVVEQPGRDYAEVERELIASVRKEVRGMAAPILKKIGPLVPGTRRVLNTVYDFTNDAKSVRFSTPGYIQTIKSPLGTQVWKLDMENIPFPLRKDCFGLAEQMVGFRLKLTDERDGTSKTLAEDKRIPASRPCPLENKIEEVVTYTPNGDLLVIAVLVRYAHPGFEGADGSLLAITHRAEANR